MERKRKNRHDIDRKMEDVRRWSIGRKNVKYVENE